MQTQAERSASVGAVQPLDLHEGIGAPPDPRTGGCTRWPEHLKIANLATGELFEGRCRATNLCEYCRTLFVVETVEMLTLDAMENAPTLWCVLTARNHLTRSECRDHLRNLRKSVRKRWPSVEWFTQVEFQRRGALHLNLLLKGVPVTHLDELQAHVTGFWCARPGIDAKPVGQWFGVVQDGVGVVRYISKMLAHGLKKEQAPPLGWRGHRTSQTRGYLVRPASVMREEARSSLRVKRALWKGQSLEVAMHAEANRAAYELVREYGYRQSTPEPRLSPHARKSKGLSEYAIEWQREYVAWLRSLGSLESRKMTGGVRAVTPDPHRPRLILPDLPDNG